MSAPANYFVMQSDAQAAAFARVLSHSFGRSEEEGARWISTHPRENVRLLEHAGRVSAGLILIHMGQFFGGRSVPMVGIQGVGVAPEARGRGAASELMRRTVQELHQNQVAISTLYPATQALYRRSGYEQAGHRFEVRVPLSKLDSTERSLTVRPMEPSDKPSVREVYTRSAAAGDGALDRTDLIWWRIEFPPPNRDVSARAFVVEGESGGVEAYVYLSQYAAPSPAGGGKFELHIHDMAAATERAGRRLWSFFAGYSTIGSDLVWLTGPFHPLLALLDEQPYSISFRNYWMVRIVDLPAAIAARGYPSGLRSSIHIHISDETLPDNAGPWVIDIVEGRASATRGGRADLRMSIETLASLFCGFMSAPQLALIGRISGPDAALEVASAAFAPRAVPAMTDMF